MQFKIKWHQCPHVNHPSRCTIIEAASAADAEQVLADHILRTYQTDWYATYEVAEYTPLPESLGKVIA